MLFNQTFVLFCFYVHCFYIILYELMLYLGTLYYFICILVWYIYNWSTLLSLQAEMLEAGGYPSLMVNRKYVSYFYECELVWVMCVICITRPILSVTVSPWAILEYAFGV